MLRLTTSVFFHALHSIAKNGCTWRALPKDFGNWSTIYCRFRYWIAIGVFDRIEKELQSQAIAIKGIKSLALDSTYIKVHPDGTGAPKKRTAIHRQESWRMDHENPLYCNG